MNRLPLTLFLIFFVHLVAFSQSDSSHLTTIASKLQKQTVTHPVEKAYLQLNKPGYSIGDTIWFKGYMVVGAGHQPSALSRVLYVDLVDGRNNIVKSLQLKNDNGISAGEFVLSDKMLPGNYKLRAYTNWIRNAGPEYFFNATLAVGDIQTNAVFVKPVYSVATGEMVNAKFSYTDKFGHPYVNREVVYEVRADTGLLFRGKGITDGTGNLFFSFPGKTAPGQRVVVNSSFKIAGGIVINKITPVNLANSTIDIQFFPEGGQLVNDVRSKVAFKAIGVNGLGVDIKGTIVDNENNEVAFINTQHAGMGVFALTPQAGKTYTAKITLADNLVITKPLPAGMDKGFVLAVNNNDSTKLTIRVATNTATLQENKDETYYVVGQSGGVIYYTTYTKLDNASFTASVPKSKFPAGIAQFTLFSQNNEPLNERVAFIGNNSGVLNLKLSSPKTTYAAKEKVNLSVAAKDNTGKPAQGSFSLTVFNDDITPVNENNENSILANILLTSDLKGYVEEPNYYFNPNNDQTQAKADLDILMLTQGYRRFEWKAIMADNYAVNSFKPEKGLSVSGTLTASNGKPVPNGKIKALLVSNGISIDTTGNEQGKFNLAGLDFTDTAKVVIQARKANDDKDVNIKLDSKTVPSIYKSLTGLETGFTPQVMANASTTKADTMQIVTAIKSNAFKFNQNNNLKEVTVKERKNYGTENAPWMPTVTRSANLNGPGHADMVFDDKQLEDCTDFIECVMNKMPGVLRKIDTKGVTHYFFSRHVSQSLTAPPEIMFSLDGQFALPEYVRNLNLDSRQIQTVEVLNSSNFLNIYGAQASGGLIVVTLKNGGIDPGENFASKVSPGVITANFKGYYKAKEFYLPKYTASNIALPDSRDAVYWNPNVSTDEKGAFPIQYFNSDVKGSYRAVVEGIDNDGNLGRFVYRYKVE